MAIAVHTTRRLRVGEDDTLGVDCRAGLKKNELITGVTSVTSAPAGLTVDNGQVNAAAVEIEGQDVPAGKAVLCDVTGGVAGVTYEVIFTVATSRAPAVKTEGVLVQCFA